MADTIGNGAELEARLAELEIKAGFAEDLLDALNGTIYRQQQEIERLQREMKELRDQLRSSMPAEAGSLRDEIPPHY